MGHPGAARAQMRGALFDIVQRFDDPLAHNAATQSSASCTVFTRHTPLGCGGRVIIRTFTPNSRAAVSFVADAVPPAFLTTSQSIPRRRNVSHSSATENGGRPIKNLPFSQGNGASGGSIWRQIR